MGAEDASEPQVPTVVEKATKEEDNKDDAVPAVIENMYAKEKKNKADNAADSKHSKQSGEVFSPELLRLYYSRIFPYEWMYDWLSYSDPSLFSRREFSFTIYGDSNEEIYMRYRSFSNASQLREAVQKYQPRKMDIGAVFSHAPKLKDAAPTLAPVQRELVFDVDLTDYDDVRKCGCAEAAICHKCWKYMTVAVKILDKGLRDDFGFERIAWFYSGRRGVHAWVCDESARNLTNAARTGVANYFELALQNDRALQEAVVLPVHPALNRAFEMLEPMFIESVLPADGHGLLGSKESCEELLNTLPESATAVRDKLTKRWSMDDSTPAEKWNLLKQYLSVATSSGSQATKKTKMSNGSSSIDDLKLWPMRTVFRQTYPRLDINVSKMQNHLLKSPFCVHPKTGRVCVPIRVEDVDDFDPFSVPTLAELVADLDKKETQSKSAWQNTRLRPYFEPFVSEFLEPLCKEARRKQRDISETKAASLGDF